MKTMKKIVAILAVAMMLCSILPLSVFAAENVADLDKLTANTGYGTRTTPNGWVATNSAVAQSAMTNQAMSVILNGKTTAKGTLTSPILTEGISELSFSYGYGYKESKGVNATINIKDTAGNIVATNSLVVSSITQNTAYSFNWVLDTAVTGNFVIEILNNSPSNSTSNKDRLSIWNVTWVSAAVSADCDHDSLSCGDGCSACDYIKEHKFANNCVAECENGCGTANPNYADHVYTGIYDVSCEVCLAKRVIEGMPAADSELTIAQAIELGVGVGASQTYTEGKYYVTGVITEIYNTTYGNLYITDGENTFTVYGLYSADGSTRYDAMTDKPEAGMTIKVYGVIGNYNGAAQMQNGWLIEATSNCEHEYEFECSTICKLCGYGEREAVCVTDAEFACVDGLCIYCGGDVAALEHDFDDEWDGDCNYGCGYTREVEDRPAISEHTISFATTTDRVSQDSNKQVWSDGTLTFTNNKAASSNPVADYSNPVRLYAGSEIVIECGGMTEIVFDCNNATYATALKNSIGDAATVDSDKVTVTFAESVDSFTVAKLTAQVRLDSITVTAVRKGDADCAHEFSAATCTEPATCALCGAVEGEALGHNYVADIIDATCTAAGSATYECSVCFHSYDETIPMKSHSYVDGFCSGCGAELPLESTLTFDADKTQRKEFGNESQKWENTGLVLINNKGTYNQNLGDYSNPIRLYKGTEIIISFPGMTSLVIDGPASADYAWDDTLAGYTFTKADGVYTITFAEPTDSITLTAANQVRANSITASRVVPCAHEYDNACDVDCNLCYETREVQHSVQHAEAKAATCAENGNIEHWYCDVCGMAWLNAECTTNTNLKAVKLPATGEHTYDDDYDADCNVCGDIREVDEEPVEIVYGDTDGDGEVTMFDSSLLSQYLSGYDVTLDEAAADTDGDGEVTMFDSSLLSQYLAGYDVTLGPVEPDQNQFNDGTLSDWPQ